MFPPVEIFMLGLLIGILLEKVIQRVFKKKDDFSQIRFRNHGPRMTQHDVEELRRMYGHAAKDYRNYRTGRLGFKMDASFFPDISYTRFFKKPGDVIEVDFKNKKRKENA